MNFHKVTLQYDGTDRRGFQLQDGLPTIQGDLNASLRKLLRGDFSTRAASRTDQGVHAIAQVVKISAEDPTLLDVKKLNEVLPPHIRCLALSPCEATFSSSHDQTSKEYRYLFTDQADHPYIARGPNQFNIGDMQICIEMLKGKNDFRNFWSIGGVSNTTLRDIFQCDLSSIDPQVFFKETIFSVGEITSCWQFRIVGSGFLKHMIRHLVGALWLVGGGSLSVDDFSKLLHGDQKQQRPWKKADPRGLYLLKVSYE